MTTVERPCDETIRRALRRILESKAFARSERLRAFLAYVVEKEMAGEGHQLKGYSIAIDVFGRPQAFNADSLSTRSRLSATMTRRRRLVS